MLFKNRPITRILAIISFVFTFIFGYIAIFKRPLIHRLYNGALVYFKSRNHVNLYKLTNDKQTIEDITGKLIANPNIPESLKIPLRTGKRKIIIFRYPSDQEKVAGYLSYIPSGQHRTVIFLRGGNGNFGILRPNNRFSYLKDCNVAGTLYRGNLYGGTDEYGGNDIHDVTNLLKFFPKLEAHTKIKLTSPYAMVGVSRGAMQMFTSLNQSKYVRSRVNKAISLSGNTDLRVAMQWRPEMRFMFNNFRSHSNHKPTLEAWVKARNPVDQTNLLDPSLQVLLIYGQKDKRVAIEEQTNFLEKLKDRNIKAKFVLFKDANHGMDGHMEKAVNEVEKFLLQ